MTFETAEQRTGRPFEAAEDKHLWHHETSFRAWRCPCLKNFQSQSDISIDIGPQGGPNCHSSARWWCLEEDSGWRERQIPYT